MTPGELLVLAFLAFNPRPVCTIAFPQGVVTDGTVCPPRDISTDSRLANGLPCIRIYKA